MSDQHIVRMGELAVANAPDSILIALGLGSCIGLCAYDPIAKISGMAHVVLPTATGRAEVMPAKSMDVALPNLLQSIESAGGKLYRLKFVLAGGARLFANGNPSQMDVGARNIDMAIKMLDQMRIKPVAADLGGNVGRTLSIYTGTGIVTVRKAGDTETILADLSAMGKTMSVMKSPA